jgi:hypothetical protein
LVIQPVVTYINGKAETHLSDIAVYALSINATWLNAVTFIYTVNANKLANTSKTNMSDALKGITGFEEGELRSGYTDFHARFWCSFSLWGGGIRVYVDAIPASMPTGRGKLLILISILLKIEVLSRLFFHYMLILQIELFWRLQEKTKVNLVSVWVSILAIFLNNKRYCMYREAAIQPYYQHIISIPVTLKSMAIEKTVMHAKC